MSDRDNTSKDDERRLALLAVNELLTSPKAGTALANLMANMPKAQERQGAEANNTDPALSSPPERYLTIWECEGCHQHFADWNDRNDAETTLCLECQLER